MRDAYVPDVGFRDTRGVRMPARTVVARGERALAVMRLLSTGAGTELSIEVKDEELTRACGEGRLDHQQLRMLPLRLRDERGREYAPAQLPNGYGLGQHEFGFFSREAGFEPIPEDVRQLVLEVHGVLGDWEVPIEVRPIADTDVAPTHELDASTDVRGITVAVRGVAFTADATIVAVTADAPGRSMRGIGAELQRQNDSLLVLVDERGRRYVEELTRETVAKPSLGSRREYAKFPPLAPDVGALVLHVPYVVVDDAAAVAEVALPITEPRDVSFGRYGLRLGPSTLARDLPAPPGGSRGYGLRFSAGPAGDEAELVQRPRRVYVDGVERSAGWGWNADPGRSSVFVHLPEDAAPTAMRLAHATVRIRGPWEIAFAVPPR